MKVYIVFQDFDDDGDLIMGCHSSNELANAWITKQEEGIFYVDKYEVDEK